MCQNSRSYESNANIFLICIWTIRSTGAENYLFLPVLLSFIQLFVRQSLLIYFD